jgi:hypothetical protein
MDEPHKKSHLYGSHERALRVDVHLSDHRTAGEIGGQPFYDGLNYNMRFNPLCLEARESDAFDRSRQDARSNGSPGLWTSGTPRSDGTPPDEPLRSFFLF